MHPNCLLCSCTSPGLTTLFATRCQDCKKWRPSEMRTWCVQRASPSQINNLLMPFPSQIIYLLIPSSSPSLAHQVTANLVEPDPQHAATMVRLALRVRQAAAQLRRSDINDRSTLPPGRGGTVLLQTWDPFEPCSLYNIDAAEG